MKKLLMLISTLFVLALLAPAVSAQEKEDFEVKETIAMEKAEAKAAQADMAKILATMDAKKLAVGEAKQGKKKGKKEKANEYFAFCQYFVDRFRASENVQALCAELGVKVPGKPAGAASLGDMEYQALVSAAKAAQEKAEALKDKAHQEGKMAAEYYDEAKEGQAKLDYNNGYLSPEERAEVMKDIEYLTKEINEKNEKLQEHYKEAEAQVQKKIDDLYAQAEKEPDPEKAAELRKQADEMKANFKKYAEGVFENDYKDQIDEYNDLKKKKDEQEKRLKTAETATPLSEEEKDKIKKGIEEAQKNGDAWKEQQGKTYSEYLSAQAEADAAWDKVKDYESGMSGGSSGGGETPAVEEPKTCLDICKEKYPSDQEGYEKCSKECK